MAARLDLGMEWSLRVLALSLFAHEQPTVPVSQARCAKVLESILCPRDREKPKGQQVWGGAQGGSEGCVLDS